MDLTHDQLTTSPSAQNSSEREAHVAASYARIAETQDDGLISQHDDNERRALTDGWHLPEGAAFRFTDNGASGASLARAGLIVLLEIVMSGRAPFARLYVRDRARLSRDSDPRQVSWLESVLAQHGVHVRYVADSSHELAHAVVAAALQLSPLTKHEDVCRAAGRTTSLPACGASRNTDGTD